MGAAGGERPLPGDPGALRATAEHLELLGEALVAQAGRVKRIDPGECWVGLAAERFGDHRDEVPPALESAATRCFDAAAALKRYAPRLEEAYHVVAEPGELKLLLPAGVVIEPPPEAWRRAVVSWRAMASTPWSASAMSAWAARELFGHSRSQAGGSASACSLSLSHETVTLR